MGTLVFLKNSSWMHREEWVQVLQKVKHRIAMERERMEKDVLSHVWLFATPCGSLQARILEWVAVPSPGDLTNPGIEPRSPTLQAYSSPAEPQGKSHNTGVGRLSLLQGIFPTQEWNRGLLQCRRIAIWSSNSTPIYSKEVKLRTQTHTVHNCS